MSDILNVLQRWESLGLLEGLPSWEKEELAQVYDNATRLLLSENSLRKIPSDVFDIYDSVYIPICRRLYRRVGVNFDIQRMMSSLLEEVDRRKGGELKFNPKTPEKNPIVEFCINFADSYEDDYTNKSVISDEEYEDKVNKLLENLKIILLNEKMVSYVDRDGEDWKIVYSEGKKTKSQTRFWNQKIGTQLLSSVLSDFNKN
jgi:hypothetical protein